MSARRLEFPTTRDRAAWQAAGSPTLKRLGAVTGPGSVKRIASNASDVFFYHPAALTLATHARDPEQVLPTTVEAMVDLLESVASNNGASSNWPAYADLPPTDPSLQLGQRAALVRAIARAPSAKLLGKLRDPLGYSVCAVSGAVAKQVPELRK